MTVRHIVGGVLTAATLVRLSAAQGPPCISRHAGSVPAAYATTVARERTLVCEQLVTRIPGVQVAVAIDGKLVWSEGFGYADAERKQPVTRETQFRIGSVSKPLTAAAVGLLYEQGKLDLDAPVQRYVPSFPDKGHPITTRQLAGHLAGIRHYKDQEFLLNRHFATVREGLTIFQDDSLLFPPGTRFSYSSYAWNLVSAVVEGASGENFLPYISAHVFRPLGLTHTAPDRADSLIRGRTQFYDRDSAGTFHIAPTVDLSYKWAGGGFVSTAEDLVKFGSALLGPGFLKRETLDLLFTSQRTSAGEETGYGIGWFLRTDSVGHRWVFHGGGSVGGTAAFGLDRDSRVVVAILANLSEAPLDPAEAIGAAFEHAAAVQGTWEGTFMVGPKDSVIATFVLRASAERDGWVLLLPGHEPHPTRVVAIGGDSVVTETGPYASTRLPGETVTTRITGHYRGDGVVGSFVAHYSSGETSGRIQGRRTK